MKLLLVEDDIALGEALVEVLQGESVSVQWIPNASTLSDALARQPDLIISDINLGSGPDGYQVLHQAQTQCPSTPVILMTAYSDVQGAVRALKAGATDYLAKPFKPSVLKALIAKHLQQTPSDVIAEDPESLKVLALARRIATSTASVFITGDSGTGKEVLSRYIHDHSDRADGPFVALNCAAIPETLLEATLFGYEKGAFTGALKAMPGKFEQADGGTLLLDEVTEMNIDLQAKLLRVLQERVVERLGTTRSLQIDVRIIATTNRDPLQAVSEGKLREDLYYRLNVMPLAWLPLAERPADILPLAKALLKKHALQSGLSCPTLSEQATQQIQTYPWPGNIRELENCMHRSLVLCAGDRIDPSHTLLPMDEIEAPLTTSYLRSTLAEQEFAQLREAIERNGGKKEQAAKALGISPRTLRHKLAKYRAEGLCLD